MKKKIEEIAQKQIADLNEKKISRKDAIKKTGYMALSAATMMMLLSDNAKAAPAASSPPAGPGNGGWN